MTRAPAEIIDAPTIRPAEVVSFPVCLEFGRDVPAKVRSRISYAFRVFAAIYSHPVQDFPHAGTLRCVYGNAARIGDDAFLIPALYATASPGNGNREKLIREEYAGQIFHLRLGKDPATGKPDWLGEIFQWLSSSYETRIAARDAVGRIPFSDSVFTREQISPLIPHAMLLMAWMESALLGRTDREELPRATSPIPGGDHLVVCSHDIDFHYTTRSAAAKRLLKNMALAFQLYGSTAYFNDSLKMLLSLLRGQRPGDYIPGLLDAMEQREIRSTFFVVASRKHPRDPDYDLAELVTRVGDAAKRGFSIGLHGSYKSVIEGRDLADEASVFNETLGYAPRASRQHWLRFDEHRNLFEQVQSSGVQCDSTLGFPDRIGFRNGSSFAFPPYDFANEKAHEFLEIPLVLMDGSLAATSQALGMQPQTLAEQVLEESRKYGWGGISILWHNPVEPLSVPASINQVFWNCASQLKQKREIWMSADQFLAVSLPRYQRAGLLKGISLRG